MAGHAGVLHGSDFLDLVFLKQTATHGSRPADVTLAAGGMAIVAVVAKRLLHLGIAEIGPTGGQSGVIARQILVQAGGGPLSRLGVANAAEPLGVLQGILHHAFVGRILVVCPFDTTVAADAVLDIVDRNQELVTDENLLPCLQRRQLPRSTLAGGFFRLHLLFYSQGFQAWLVSVTGHTVHRPNRHRK